MSNTLITTRTEGAIRFVTINRPEKRNAITPQMLVDLAEAVRRTSTRSRRCVP